MKPVTLIGTGNVAWQLGTTFLQAGIKTVEVLGRDPSKAEELAQHLGAKTVSDWNELAVHEGIFFLCVKDDAIAEAAASFLQKPRLLVHTSGSVSIDVLQGKALNIGVFYPIQSLKRNRPVNWSVTPICLEASSTVVLDELNALASRISNKIVALSSDERRWLHLAAVIVSNFINFLYIQAESLCKDHGLSFDLLQPLIKETALRLEISSPINWQTGPARRHDEQVIQHHLDMLKDNPQLQQLYREFSAYIVCYYSNYRKD